MYLVKIYDGYADDIGITMHSPNTSKLKVDEGVIDQAINGVDTFDFAILPNNPAYGNLNPFRTLINIYNTKTRKFEFEGRILKPTESMSADRSIIYLYQAEGELAYLHDSQSRHYEFRGGVFDLLKIQLDYHNSQVETYKRFEIGNVSVTDSNDYIYLYLSPEEDTLESIMRTLVDNLGGELKIRKENDVRYLDYLQRVGFDSNEPIHLNKNLVSLKRDIDPTNIITRLTPLGERIESENEDATDASQQRLTIESVNEGLPYIDNLNLIAEFGLQGGSQTWDDVTQPSILKTKGQQFLDSQKTALYQYEIEALDLKLIGKAMESFEIGNSYPVYNQVMKINERLRVIGKKVDINNPQDSKMTVGDKFKSLSDYQNDLSKSTQLVYSLQKSVDGLGSKTGKLTTSIAQVQTQLKQVDIDILPHTLNTLQTDINEFKDALENLIIPKYQEATIINSGLMSSTDKSKLDNLQNYSVATEINSGLMSSQDKKELNTLGDVSLLNTIEKTDVVSAINELVEKLYLFEGGT